MKDNKKLFILAATLVISASPFALWVLWLLPVLYFLCEEVVKEKKEVHTPVNRYDYDNEDRGTGAFIILIFIIFILWVIL